MRKFDTKSFELDVNVKSAVPIYEQIKNAVKVAILSDKLKEGDKVVSIRDLSSRFNINPLTIMKAYNQLEYEGYLFSKRGSGYYVKTGDRGLENEKTEMFRKAVADFVKQVGALGFTVKDLLKELTEYTKTGETSENRDHKEGKTNDKH